MNHTSPGVRPASPCAGEMVHGMSCTFHAHSTHEAVIDKLSTCTLARHPHVVITLNHALFTLSLILPRSVSTEATHSCFKLQAASIRSTSQPLQATHPSVVPSEAELQAALAAVACDVC